MNRTSLAVPARTFLNQKLNPYREHGYTKLPPGSVSGSDALNRWSQERLGSRRPPLHTRTERDRATFSPTGETRNREGLMPHGNIKWLGCIRGIEGHRLRHHCRLGSWANRRIVQEVNGAARHG
jgi:hypothetical protein